MADAQDQLVTLAEVKQMLEKAEASREDLSYEQKLALEHARRFARFDAATSRTLVEELTSMGKCDVPTAIRIVDTTPSHPDDIKAIFAKSRVNLSDADIQKILETVAKYLPES